MRRVGQKIFFSSEVVNRQDSGGGIEILVDLINRYIL